MSNPTTSIPREQQGSQAKQPLRRDWYCLGLLLLLGNLCWLSAGLADYWVTREDGEDDTYFSLVGVRKGPDNMQDMSWNCFVKTYCNLDDDGDLCKSWKAARNGSILYLVASGLAVLFTFLLIERFTFLYAQKDAGWKWLTWVILILVPLAQLVAIAGYFGISGVEFSGSCSDPPEDLDDEVKFCTSRGPILGIIATFWTFITSAVCFLLYLRRDKSVDTGVKLQHGKCFLLSNFWCWGLLLTGLGCAFILLVASLVVEDWVERNDTPKFEGGLLTCRNCDPQEDWYAYDCYSSKYCHIDNDGYCELFKNLKKGGYAYLYLSVITLSLMIIWGELIGHMMIGRDFGANFLNYLLPTVATVLMAIAVVYWFNITEASMSGNCDEDNSEVFQKPSICPRHGPYLGAVCFAVLAIFLIFHFILYSMRRFTKEVEKRPVEVEMQPTPSS